MTLHTVVQFRVIYIFYVLWRNLNVHYWHYVYGWGDLFNPSGSLLRFPSKVINQTNLPIFNNF